MNMKNNSKAKTEQKNTGATLKRIILKFYKYEHDTICYFSKL